MQLYFWRAFLLFVFTIPISQFISVRLLVVVLLFSVFIKGGNKFGIYITRSWDIILYISILVIGLIYSNDLKAGLNVMETNFSFIAIPIILSCLPSLDKPRMNQIFRAFGLGLIIASSICLTFAIYRYIHNPDIHFFLFYEFTKIISFQPTYFAYYLIFAISIGLFFVFNEAESTNYLIRYFTILFLFFVLILTGGQTAFIGLLFVFSFFILKFLVEEKSFKRKADTSFIAFMLFCMFLVSLEEKKFLIMEFNDSWERGILWESALSAIPNLFLGAGTGDYRSVLNEYYQQHGLAQFAVENYNSHNQIIQLLVSNGILGVLSYCIVVLRPLFIALQNKNVLTILCLFPFLVYGITEVFLGRYQGVVFFVLLHQLFIIFMYSGKSFFTDKMN